MTQEQIVYKKYEFFNNIIKNNNKIEEEYIIATQILDLVYYFNTFKEIFTTACCEGKLIDSDITCYPYITFLMSDDTKLSDIITQIVIPISNLSKIEEVVIMIKGTNNISFNIYWKEVNGITLSTIQDIKNILSLASLTFDDEFAKNFYKKIKQLN